MEALKIRSNKSLAGDTEAEVRTSLQVANRRTAGALHYLSRPQSGLQPCMPRIRCPMA